MIKKIDKLIVKAFVGPFIATFFITLFVLVLQFFWLYIDDIVGKGVDMFTVGRLVGYVAATLVPLALPLAVLLSSIMTFGNLGETFELVAAKSAGISLLRFMRPLFLVSLVICYIAFLFNNDIIPVANLKMNTLKYDIIMSKPAFDIKEGVFYDRIEGYVIKIGKKEKDDSTIRNVVIYEQNPSGLQDNIIVAEKGKMVVTPDKKSLAFKLENGSIYQEKGERFTTNTEFMRMNFSAFKKVLDLSSFKLNNTNDSAFRNNYQMLSMRQLNKMIDSLKKADDSYRDMTAKNVRGAMKFSKWLDTTGWAVAAVKLPPAGKAKTFQDLIPDSAHITVTDKALAEINSVKSTLDQPSYLFDNEQNDLHLHQIAWHEKLTLSIACLVMFLIGAPLGSIIRKGGIGLPLVFAVIFFVIFFLLNNFGKKFVKEDVLTPLSGMWLPTYVLTPIGLFLTYKALHDSQLFNKEFYFRLIKNIRPLLQRAGRRAKTQQAAQTGAAGQDA
jgi:lipopolysaccharide export system permease protein